MMYMCWLMMGQWTKADAGATANRAARSKHLFGWMELMVTLLDVLWAIGWIFTTSCVVGWGGERQEMIMSGCHLLFVVQRN